MVSHMATWDGVRRLAPALPQTVEGSSREGLLSWSVRSTTPHFNGYPAILVRLDR
jgi:hypothetical protein